MPTAVPDEDSTEPRRCTLEERHAVWVPGGGLSGGGGCTTVQKGRKTTRARTHTVRMTLARFERVRTRAHAVLDHRKPRVSAQAQS